MTFARGMVAALLLVVRSASGEDACRPDVERLCAGIPPGGGRIMACLKANQAQVSPACKAQMASITRKVKEVGAACADDVQSYCPDVKPGQGAVVRCLAANQATLAPACRDALQGAREKLAEFKRACGKDARRHCKGIPRGEGRILACLKSKQAELSPACQAMMK